MKLNTNIDRKLGSPVVSVVMSALNAASTISMTLRSLINQSYENWELVLIDDGSSDATHRVIESFTDKRIRFERDGYHLGLAARLNQAVNLARGKYIARLDADDLAYPERLERQLVFLEENPRVDLVGSGAMVFCDQGDPIGLFPVRIQHEEICAEPNVGFYLAHPTWMGRREWFLTYRYRHDVIRGQDQDLLLRAHNRSVFAALVEPLIGYRQSRITVRNILLGRLNYTRSLLSYAIPASDYRLAVSGIVTQLLRGLPTIMLTAFGSDRYVLRKRFSTPTSHDLSHWHAIWSTLSP